MVLVIPPITILQLGYFFLTARANSQVMSQFHTYVDNAKMSGLTIFFRYISTDSLSNKMSPSSNLLPVSYNIPIRNKRLMVRMLRQQLDCLFV